MWFRVMRKANSKEYSEQIDKFCNEAIELKKIFSAIILKSGGQ